jgi:proteasome activator subunit 4
VSHEQFKGALFVLLGTNGKSFLIKHNWATFRQICPAVIEACHSEKPSIVAVMGMLLDTVLRQMDTFMIEQNVPDQVVERALDLWTDMVRSPLVFSSINPTLVTD